MTAQPFFHGKDEPRREHPSGVETRSANNGGSYAGDDYPFRADVLVSCPYCEPDDGASCDYCAGSGSVLADEVLTELDLHRLDCAVDALRGADLSAHRDALSRIASNLNDLMENPNGHAH